MSGVVAVPGATLIEVEDQSHCGAENARRTGCPIRPLGHSAGSYFLLSAAGQFVEVNGSHLEAGRSVESLFIEKTGQGVQWCAKNFPLPKGDWCRKTLGRWIMSECGCKGVIDPSRLDFRKVGTWRTKAGGILVHCGSHVEDSSGSRIALHDIDDSAEWITDASITPPGKSPASDEEVGNLVREIGKLWGWSRGHDAALWMGWLGMALLGGFPKWRTHLYVMGKRGSGKTELMECASLLLGAMAGEVLNDASEAGIRQLRNHQARALLLDEAEPTPNSSKMSDVIALARRMSGGSGGRVARGTANHKAISFSTIGSVYLSSILQQPLDPQDRSRFLILRLNAVPRSGDALEASQRLLRFRRLASELAPKLWRRMIRHSQRWDETVQIFAAEGVRLGADNREAATCAAIMAGFDLLLHSDPVDAPRLKHYRPMLLAALGDMQQSEEAAEGEQCVQHLMSSFLPSAFPQGETIGGAIVKAYQEGPSSNENAKLAIVGIRLIHNEKRLYIASGKGPQMNEIFRNTKWVGGAHKSALETLEGVIRPKNSQRVGCQRKVRVLEIPLELCGLDLEAGDF